MTEARDALRLAVERHAGRFLDAREAGLAMPDLHARVLAEVEHALIGRVLAATGGNQVRAAAILGLNRNTLRKKIRDLGLAAP